MRVLVACTLLSLTLPCAAAVDYETQIKPIFEAKCLKCHGEKRQLGELAMHAAALPGVIEDGLILAGDAESSDVYSRLILEEGDKLRMPKGGDPLPEKEIELIKNWINEGALLTKAEGAPMPHDEKAEQQPEEAPPAPEPAKREVLAGLEDAGATVVPLFAGSPLLSISFPSNREQVNDDTLDAVAAAGPNVAWLNLAGTKVTDAGVAKLAACANLARLHLENTGVTDASAATLGGLERLEYLNLYGTTVTDAALEPIGKLPRLTALYLWKSKVSYEAAKKLMSDRSGLDINLGWDHPGVVRDRLKTELARVTAKKEEATKKTKEAEAVLEEAKKQLQAATDREKEIQKELEALDKPAEEAPAEEKPAEEQAPEKA